MNIISLFNEYHNHFVDIRKTKHLDSWYRKKLKKRSEHEFLARWNTEKHVNHEMIKEFANIMSLPNHYIFPHDRMFILFCPPYNDLREISAIILLEKYGICNMNEHTIKSEYKYAKNIFGIR